tara:strand:- start:222 stop:575 length:354 start_codon:yes stop_codon:yes gene_type:complete
MKKTLINATSSGTAHVIIGPSEANTGNKNIIIHSLYIVNTDTTSIGVDLYLSTDNGATVHIPILDGIKIGIGYTLDVFEDTPFEYSDTYGLFFKMTDAAYTANATGNYSTSQRIQVS